MYKMQSLMKDSNLKEDLRLLQDIALDQKAQAKWVKSLFGVIKVLPTSNKGEVAERYIHQLCLNKNIRSCRNPKPRDSYDILINDKKVEVKLATEDTKGKFQFNGIRLKGKYDFVLVLGVSPNDVYFNIFSEADVKTKKAGKLANMEQATVASHKLTKDKKELYAIYDFESIINKQTNL